MNESQLMLTRITAPALRLNVPSRDLIFFLRGYHDLILRPLSILFEGHQRALSVGLSKP